MASKKRKIFTKDHAWETTHAWEDVVPTGEVDPGYASESELKLRAPDVWGAEAGRMLMDYVLLLHFNHRPLSAKGVAIIAHWAYRAGATGPEGKSPRDFAYNPDSASGNFQKHLDKVLGINTSLDSFYKLATPIADQTDRSRIIKNIPVNLPYEDLEEEVLGDPDFDKKLTEWVEYNKSLPAFAEHEVVLANPGKKVHAVNMYIDGVPHQNHDTTIGFWVASVVSNKRHLICTLRKSEKCACGCLGWCSFWTIFNFISWAFTTGAKAVRPSRKHDLTSFEPGDIGFDNQGIPLSYPLALLFHKGDEAEFCLTMGIPTWSSKTNPCRSCHTHADGLYDIDECSPDGLQWASITSEDVEQATQMCEVVVVLGEEDHRRVEAALFSRKGLDGPRGRALNASFPRLGLEKGDRLEPSTQVPDVFAFKNLSLYPIVATFWRRSRETLVRHRNPMYGIPGYSHRTMVYDILHLLYLGCVKDWVLSVVWACILVNVWHVSSSTQLELDDLSMTEASRDLVLWYRSLPKAPGGKQQFSEVRSLNPSRLGTRSERKLSTKASETKGLLYFCLHLLAKYRERLPGHFVHVERSGESMRILLQCISGLQGRIPCAATFRTMMSEAIAFVRSSAAFGVNQTPKFHFLLHLVWDTQRNGDPRTYATYLDESLNMELAAVASAAYSCVWHQRVLLYMKEVLQRVGGRVVGAYRSWLISEAT